MGNQEKVWAVVATGEIETIELFHEQHTALHREAEIFTDFLKDKDIPKEAEAREWNKMLKDHVFCLCAEGTQEIVRLQELEIK